MNRFKEKKPDLLIQIQNMPDSDLAEAVITRSGDNPILNSLARDFRSREKPGLAERARKRLARILGR